MLNNKRFTEHRENPNGKVQIMLKAPPKWDDTHIWQLP